MVACLSGGWWLTLGQHGPSAGKARPEPTVSHAPTVHVVTTPSSAGGTPPSSAGGTLPSSAGGTLPSVKIPVVTGTDCSDAQLALQQAGLTNVSMQVHPFDSGTATGTNPPAGQTVPAATPVTLSCGNIPAY
jgi:beta-lactam-binding protein with PASTA domain